MYRSAGWLGLTVWAVILVGGCNNAKSPSTVAKDVNSASQRANDDTAKAEERSEEKIASAEKDVSNDQRNEGHVAAVQDEKVAKTDAEGARKIALAKCESLNGERQQACKDHANAEYDLAVSQAKQERANSDPKR